MDPDFDITLNSAEKSSSDLAKGHFLDSLGLGERSLLGGLAGNRSESLEEDGVVLSSMPDDLGFPMPGVAPDRGVAAYSNILTSDRAEVAAISLPVEEDPQPEPEQVSHTAPEAETAAARDLDESLHLHCPECRGSLVLKRRHLGVEGACVWCHTPIVAAESARDGQVRIFPILGHVAAAPVIEVAAPVVEASAPVVENMSLPVDTPEPPMPSVEIAPVVPPVIEEAPVDIAAVPVAFPGFGDLMPSPAAEELPSSFSGFGFSAPPASIESPATEIVPLAEAATTTPDLESLYETGGFLAAQDAPALPVGFGETLAPAAMTAAPVASAQTNPVTEESIPGFGAFLQAPQGLTVPAAPHEPAMMGKVEEPAASTGFLTPTPWGPPTPISAPPAVNPNAPEVASLPTQDETPAELPIGFASGFGSPSVPIEEKTAPPSWEAAFGTANEIPVAATLAAPAAVTGFGEGFLNAGFGTAAPSSLFGNAAEPGPTPNTGLLIQPSTSAKVQEEVKALDDSRSFAPPFNAFSTGSSSDEEPGFAKNLFGDPAPISSLWGAGNSSDEAPTPLATFDEPPGLRATEPLFTADDTATSNPFADQSISTSPVHDAEFRVADPDESLDSATPAESPAPSGPPALPATEMTAATAPSVQPQVVSQPLGGKPKPKVRKGFIVLMVVIVGFASGAALASFVLPVEEYVSAARAFMESKFNTGVAIPQMPAMPEGLAIPTEPAAPVEAQP